MSSWVVTKNHIDYVVTSQHFYPYGEFTVFHNGERYEKTQTEWGKVLWAENIASVAFRYPDEKPDNLPGSGKMRDVTNYQFKTWLGVTQIGAYKAADSLAYQSNVHPGWETSLAKAYLDTLRPMLVSTLPEYKAADTWSIR